MREVSVRKNDAVMDELEAAMVANLPLIDCPLTHRFTPGMYIREVFMPKGAWVTSKAHLTTHPFTISKGKVVVLIDVDERLELEAPYTGITYPGTRRAIQILEDTVWTTFHAIPCITGYEGNIGEEGIKDVVKWIEDLILEKRENPLVDYDAIKSLTAKEGVCHL